MRKMTTSSSTPSTNSDPDAECLLCNTTRENHGDRNHKFSEDGLLRPLDPPPKPRQEAPVHRDEQQIKATSFATLMEVLVEKNILDAKDVIRIFTGQG